MDAQLTKYLEGVVNATEFSSGTYLNPGNYLLEVQKLSLKNGFKGVSFIAEFKVLEAIDTDDKTPASKVGTTPGFVVKIDKAIGQGNMKTFIKALTGSDDGELTVEALQMALSDRQPFRGKLIRDAAYNKPTQKGENFTAHKWTYVDQTVEDIKTRAARIASGQ